ncbi:MAG TPA: hypothetical protein VLF91_03010 [Candidatus Saccharimonadales bacterium]|nr:hypothetical protein [Candidatus Saccharimonadales bacterium]
MEEKLPKDEPKTNDPEPESPTDVTPVVDKDAGDDTPADSPTQAPKATGQKWYRRRSMLLIAAALVMIVAGGASAYAYHALRGTHKATSTTTTGQQTTTTSQSSKPAQPAKPNELSATFFDTPKLLTTDLKAFKDPETYFGQSCDANNANCAPIVTASDLKYYQIGTTAKNQAIIVIRNQLFGDAGFEYVAIEDTPNHYALLGRMDSRHAGDITQGDAGAQEDLAQTSAALSANFSLNTTDTIPGLLFPDKATPAGLAVDGQVTSYPAGYLLPTGLSDIRGAYSAYKAPLATAKLGEASGRSFYQATEQDSDNFKVMEIYATVNAVYAARYILHNDFTAADGKGVSINWSSGTQNKSDYFTAGQGCGSPTGYVIAKAITKSALTSVATYNGTTLYALPTSSPLFAELYKDYTDFSSSLNDSTLKNLSQQQFQDDHGVFVTQNALGEWVVYQRSDLFITGGCGKPVVYLYPQQPTTVGVQVGADVRKSDPHYVAGQGWKNVLALPTGQLLYGGHSYDSLYWEGFGNGPYPDIQTGTVVTRAQAPATMRSQLAQQGLNPKEINDFMAFWQAKLPSTPYIRLTWLTLPQINALAPLTITPRPTTTIRVFLDFAGLNQPETLPAQHLSALPREGFTVVEWGGLLRDGSLTR